MFINYIKLKNYRQYKNVTINFPLPSGDKNFIIIEGSNGSGKTNILNAIDWCLYGEELHLDKNNIVLPLVNMLSLDKNPNNCEVSVEIQMLDNEKKKIIFTRCLYFRSSKGNPVKISDPLANSPDGSRFTILKQIDKDMKEFQPPEYLVQQLTPRSLEEYFLFDGEHLERYFKEKSGEKIKEEVFKISQLELLKKVIDHLNEVKREFLRTSKNLSPELQDLIEQSNLWSRSLDTYKNELAEIIEQKNTKEKREKELSEKLRSLPKIKELQEERIELEAAIKDLNKKIKESEDEKFDFLIDYSLSIFGNSAIQKVINMINLEVKNGNIPPKIDQEFLERKLKEGICICGNDVSEKNMKSRKKLENFINNINEISTLSSELQNLKESLGIHVNDLRNFGNQKVHYGKLIKQLENDYEEKSKRLNIIENIIKNSKEEQIIEWENELEDIKNSINKLSEKIGEHNTRIATTEKRKQTIEKLLNEEMEKSKQYDEIKKIISFCDEILELTNGIQNEIMEDTRKDIEDVTRKEFFNLIWKKETWKDVKINENYDVSVIHQSGLGGLGSLSRGEMQALALAFVGALSNVSGFDLPIVIDTPLGRISSEVKKNIAENLPKYLENKQVIILMTDEEYNSEVRKKLLKRLVEEYKIKFNETRLGSEAWIEKYVK